LLLPLNDAFGSNQEKRERPRSEQHRDKNQDLLHTWPFIIMSPDNQNINSTPPIDDFGFRESNVDADAPIVKSWQTV
jgi:hypothetical protein